MASNLPSHRVARNLARRLPFFYGWVIVTIGFLGVFMMGTTAFWAIPVFIGPIGDDTGWSDGAIFGALTVRFIVGAFFGMLLGAFADKQGGPSKLLLGGLLIDCAALAALRWAESPMQFILLYGVVGGAGNTGMRLVMMTLVSKWFVLGRGRAIGLASLGGSLSAVVMVPIIQVFIDSAGWRDTWVFIAGFVFVVMLPMVPLAVRAPEDIGLQPDNGATPRAGQARRTTASTERSYTLREATRTLRFWVLMAGIVFGGYSLQTTTVIMKPYFQEIGFSSAVAASALSLYGFFSIGARFIWGFVSEHTGGRNALIAQALTTAVAVVLFLLVSNQTFLYIAVAYSGLVLGGFPILAQVIWPEFFGRAHIGSITGLVQFITTLLGSMGPLIAGVVADRTGSYEVPMVVLVATWLVSAAVLFVVRPERRSATDAPVTA